MDGYNINNNCLTIINSYKTTDEISMNFALNCIRTDNASKKYEILYKRDNTSFIKEWKGHNLLYKLNIFRNHSGTVDMEYPQKWYFKLIWNILSIF